jgi:hypothetical protein
MTLAERLRGMDPADSDRYLSEIWRRFSGTEEYEALHYVLAEVAEEANGLLLSPTTEDRSRAHAAGQVTAVRRILVTMQRNVAFRPEDAKYAPFEVANDDNQLTENADFGASEFSE